MKRLFLGIAVTALLASAFVGSTTAVMAQTKTLKMQATWPASLTLYDNFTYFAEREQAIGRCVEDRCDARRPGRARLQVLDATHRSARRSACVGRLLDPQEQDRDLFTGGPGGTFGMDFMDVRAGPITAAASTLQQFYQKELAQRCRVPHPACRAAGFRLVQEADPDSRGHEGHEMPPDRHGRRGVASARLHGGQHAGRRIIPSAQRGVIDCANGSAASRTCSSFHNVWKYHYSPGRYENDGRRTTINGDVERAQPAAPGDHQVGGQRDILVWWTKWQRQNADALTRCSRSTA